MSQEPPPRPGSKANPDSPLQAAELDRTVGGATKQRRFDAPLHRSRTSPGMLATKLPPVPNAPTDFAETVPAPRHDAPTMRATPAAGMARVHIDDAPASQPGTLPPASHNVFEGQLAALQRENERLRALHSLPPDRGAWAKLGYRIAVAVVGSAILIITALGARLASNLSKVEDKNVALVASTKKAKQHLTDRDKLWNDWGDRLVEVLRCNQSKQALLNKRQFPETRVAEPGSWPIYKDSCGEIPERPRELPAPAVVDELHEP